MKTVFAIVVVFAMMIGGNAVVAQATATSLVQRDKTYAENASHGGASSNSGNSTISMDENSNASEVVSFSTDAGVSSSNNMSEPVEASRNTFSAYFKFALIIFFFGLFLYAGVVSDYERSRALIRPPKC
jgi:hypothetical protein